MASKTKLYGSVKRLGVRYGTKQKERLGKVELARRKSTKCPYCRYDKTRRVAAGVWHCGKCQSTFTGGAYAIGKLREVKEEKTGELAEGVATAQESQEATAEADI